MSGYYDYHLNAYTNDYWISVFFRRGANVFPLFRRTITKEQYGIAITTLHPSFASQQQLMTYLDTKFK